MKMLIGCFAIIIQQECRKRQNDSFNFLILHTHTSLTYVYKTDVKVTDLYNFLLFDFNTFSNLCLHNFK